MNASDIIAALGGPIKLAEALGSSRTAVCNWRREGIPARFWLPVMDLAAALGVEGVTREAVSWRPTRTPLAA